MSKPPECAAILFKTWRSILDVHLGLQSMSYRDGTPYIYVSIYFKTIYPDVKTQSKREICH